MDFREFAGTGGPGRLASCGPSGRGAGIVTAPHAVAVPRAGAAVAGAPLRVAHGRPCRIRALAVAQACNSDVPADGSSRARDAGCSAWCRESWLRGSDSCRAHGTWETGWAAGLGSAGAICDVRPAAWERAAAARPRSYSDKADGQRLRTRGLRVRCSGILLLHSTSIFTLACWQDTRNPPRRTTACGRLIPRSTGTSEQTRSKHGAPHGLDHCG
jgi:hypothetical protein